jgi:hypothetical protein
MTWRATFWQVLLGEGTKGSMPMASGGMASAGSMPVSGPAPISDNDLRMKSPSGDSSRSWEQGLTPVHYSAQRKRFLVDRGYSWGLLRVLVGGGCEVSGVFTGCLGCIFVSETAHVELKSGRV